MFSKTVSRWNRLSSIESIFCAIVFVGLFTSSILAQQPADDPKSVLDKLCTMDTQGTSLTAEGWDKVSRLFFKPSIFPSKLTIIVKSGDCTTASQSLGAKYTVGMEYLRIGTIDPQMKFSWGNKEAAQPLKERFFFTVTYGTEFWELTADQHVVHKMEGPSEWRIQEFRSEPAVSVTTAISYVQTHSNSPDPIVRANVQNTQAILARFK
jgi:hypothetical protein